MQRRSGAYKKNVHLAWMCTLVAVTALGILSYYLPFEQPHSLTNAQPLLTGWYYFTVSGDDPVAFDSPERYIPFDTCGSMTFVRRMTEQAQNAHLLLRLTYARASVYLDDVLLFENQHDPPGENPGSGMHLIALPNDYLGRELKIVMTSPYAVYAFSPDPIYFGSPASLASLVLAHSARDIALLGILVLSGLVLIGSALLGMRSGELAREWWANFCFGLFAILYGLSLASTSDLFLAVFPPLLGGDVDFVLWYLFPLPLTCYLWLKCTVYRRAMLSLVFISVTTSMPTLLGALFGLWALPASASVTNYAYIALATLAGILVVLEALEGNMLFRFIAPGVTLIVVSAVLGMVGLGRFYTLKEGLRIAGILLLIAMALFDALRTLIAKRRQEDSEQQLVGIRANLAAEQLEMADSYNQETRLLRHEIRHHLAAMAVLQREGRLEEIGEYLDRLNIMARDTDTTMYCEHTLINAILNKAAADCERRGISFKCDANVPPKISVPDEDLSILLLNMLENAVEAAHLVPESERWVEAQVRVKHGFLVVSCRNARHSGAIEQRDGRFLSTKKNVRFHGFGILVMRQVAEKHSSKLNIEYDETSFSVKTILELADEEG